MPGSMHILDTTKTGLLQSELITKRKYGVVSDSTYSKKHMG